MNTTTAEDNRARLLDMAAGGSGHTDAWIERVTLEASDTEAERTAYMYHYPPHIQRDGSRSGARHYLGTLQRCVAFYSIGEDMPDMSAIPVEDTGRRIPAEYWQKHWDVLHVEN